MADERAFIPIPVARAMEQWKPICEAYVRIRESRSPEDALWAALAAALSDDDYTQIRSFIMGEDPRFDPAVGIGLWRELLTGFESTVTAINGLETVAARVEAVAAVRDIVAYSEAIATDRTITSTFRSAVDEQNSALVDATLELVTSGVVEAANRAARTRMGRRVKLDQAKAVFALFKLKGAAASGALDPAPMNQNQAVWCNAVIGALQATRI